MVGCKAKTTCTQFHWATSVWNPDFCSGASVQKGESSENGYLDWEEYGNYVL